MFNNLKNSLRDFLPAKYQVPVKYWYSRIHGSIEKEMTLLGQIVRPDDLVVDVGGNRGIYAYTLWKLGASVEVFEPNPLCFRILTDWAANKPKVSVHSTALSNRIGSANLHIPIDRDGVEHDASASIENAGFEHARDQLVPLKTLDSYRFENLTLIKIDVEGHESAVIEGAAATLASSRPALLVEIEQRHLAVPINVVFDKIMSFGYQGFFMVGNDLRPLDKFDPANHQSMQNFGGSHDAYINNFLFLNRDRLAGGEYRHLAGDLK